MKPQGYKIVIGLIIFTVLPLLAVVLTIIHTLNTPSPKDSLELPALIVISIFYFAVVIAAWKDMIPRKRRIEALEKQLEQLYSSNRP